MGLQRLTDVKFSNQIPVYPLHWNFFFQVKSSNHEDKNQAERNFSVPNGYV